MIKKILVIGGTGYIGTPLVKKLKSVGYDLTLLIRRKGDFKDEFFDCKYFAADLLDKEVLMKNIEDFDLVINLAAVIRTLNKKRYRENVLGIENLIEVLEKKGIKKIIYFSTQSVNLKQKGPYAESKEEAEKILISSGLDYMIVRPNYVYGIDERNDFYRMASIAKKFRIMPIIGSGNYKIQPVLKEDLINIVFNFVENFRSKLIVEISGCETVSINEVARMVGEYLKAGYVAVHMPVSILKLFKNFIPFDIDGYTENRISASPFLNYNFSSFREDLKGILNLIK